jgi:SNF2 family DNA or RNA helicase
LPAKTEIVLPVELAGRQRDLYETVRASMHERVREEIATRGLAHSHIVVLDALLKLRQVCCDPRLLKLDSAKRVKESAKLEALMEMLREMLPQGRRVLLFSQFTSMLTLIEQELSEESIRYIKLTGDTRDREKPVKAFQSGEVPLFLISLKAGGTGLNLTAADTVIHYDPWWNPAVENQATDRAHRIGQNKPVFVYKLIASGSVEEKIGALQASKAALAASVLGDGTAADAALTADDIRVLFEPMG